MYRFLARHWLDLQLSDENSIRKPDQFQNRVKHPPEAIGGPILNRIVGSMLGLAVGDALGAHVEYRSHHYLLKRPVTNFCSGRTCGLEKEQVLDHSSIFSKVQVFYILVY